MGRKVNLPTSTTVLSAAGTGRSAESPTTPRAQKGTQTVGTYRRRKRIIRQGVAHVLRRLREPTHLWWTVLHQMRQASSPERSSVSFCGKPGHGTDRSKV